MTRPLNPLSVELSDQLRDRLRRLLVRVDEMRALVQQPGAWLPPVDLCELEDAVLVRVELPGVPLASMRVSLLDSALKIEGRKEAEAPAEAINEDEKPQRFLCLERAYGSFAVTINIRWPVNAERVTAQLYDGVLNVRLPKTHACGREIIVPITE